MWVTRPRPCFASGGSVGLAEGRLTGTIESGKCSLHPKLETRRDTWPPDGRTNGWMPSRTGFRGGVIDLVFWNEHPSPSEKFIFWGRGRAGGGGGLIIKYTGLIRISFRSPRRISFLLKFVISWSIEYVLWIRANPSVGENEAREIWIS